MNIELLGINETITKLSSFDRENIDSSIGSLLDKVLDEGKKEAETNFNGSILRDDKGLPKVPDVVVTTKGKENIRYLIASGSDTLYSEFGVGVLNEPHPIKLEGVDDLGKHITSNNPRLDWLHKQGLSLGSIPSWAQKHGNAPSMAMYKASIKMEQAVPIYIKEVFR